MKRIIIGTFLWAVAMLAAAQPLQQDPSVRTGKLKNGMTYYIRHNAKEAGLADFYIAQRVGSILEEPRQRGLAHFLEHMAFNGTKHFPGKGKQLGIVPWCESIGVKFGANLNAYTSIDQTVYHIGSAPIKREGIVDSCLLVLNDWSHYILLEDQEIDKERGVIHEEWRTRRAGMAMQRMMENVMPYIYKGTKYEDCMPIGSMDIVDNFPYQDLRDYYQKWYRPDLQAIIVVGDFDVDKMEKKVRKLFSKIPMPRNAAERVYYPVGNNDRMTVVVEKDKEQPITIAHLYMKMDATPDAEKNTVKYVRDDYKADLVAYMLNSRLTDLRQQANPPFISASGRAGQFYICRTKDAFSLSVSCKHDSILGGLRAAVAELERVRQHGFTQAELERAKLIQLNHAERSMKMEADQRNSRFVNRCVNHFLNAEPLISSAYNYELVKQFDTDVTLGEVNAEARQLIHDTNQVLVLFAPDKEGVSVPSEAELEQTVLSAQAGRYEAYTEPQLQADLIAQLPKAGTIVSEKDFGLFGFREFTLSNGMKVYVKPTDFAADQIEMTMRAWGGTSLYGDEDIPNFRLLASATSEGGWGDYDASTLRKMLTGKSARVVSSIGQRRQSISGTSSVKDFKTMLELAYLHFTAPRKDTTAFAGLISRTRSFLSNRDASPKVAYSDSIDAIVYGNHPRYAPTTPQMLDSVDYDRILQIYRERFSDASNFQTVIIGKVNLDELRPLLCQYLATLPSTYRHETFNEANVPQVKNSNETHVFRKKMATPQASVTVLYTAQVPFSPKNDLILDFLKRTLSIAYTDSVREEKGGTYGVGVEFDLDQLQKPDAMLKISYSADPTRYEELNPIIYKQLQNIADHGPEATSMDKVRKYLKKQYEQLIITNDYWNYIIWHQLYDREDFDKDYCKLVDEVTAADVQRMARAFIDQKRRIEVTMLSED